MKNFIFFFMAVLAIAFTSCSTTTSVVRINTTKWETVIDGQDTSYRRVSCSDTSQVMRPDRNIKRAWLVVAKKVNYDLDGKVDTVTFIRLTAPHYIGLRVDKIKSGTIYATDNYGTGNKFIIVVKPTIRAYHNRPKFDIPKDLIPEGYKTLKVSKSDKNSLLNQYN